MKTIEIGDHKIPILLSEDVPKGEVQLVQFKWDNATQKLKIADRVIIKNTAITLYSNQ